MATEVLPSPVDTGADDDELHHVACDTLDRTWCGQDARDLLQLPDPPPPLEDFCRVCVLGIEMWCSGDPCPVCGTLECIAS